MRLFLWAAVVVFALSGCSSESPPELFLNKRIRVADFRSDQFDTKRLTMTPQDIYSVFDRNIKKKNWKKIHENSWSLSILGEDPVTKLKNDLVFTFTLAPKFDDDVVVSSLVVNGEQFEAFNISDMLMQLDDAFSGRESGPVLNSQPQ